MINNSVCCIIVTYNIGDKFNTCYDAIAKQVEKVIVVDNGSNEETIKAIKKLSKNENTEIIYNDENLGIATALNKGIKLALNQGFKWILTMDNDSIAMNGMVDAMLGHFEEFDEDENIVGVFPRYVDLGYNNQDDNNIEDIKKPGYKEVNAEITSGNLLKSDIFKDIGFFEDKLFIDMVDYEFCFRIRSKGYKLVQLNDVILYHNLGNTKIKKILGKNMYCTHHNYIRRYYITRNRFYVWKKYKEFNYEELRKDKKAFWKEMLKIILLEDEKLVKIKMIFKGIKDYKNNIYGKINI